MRKVILRLMVVGVVGLSGGCTSLPKVIKALKDDPAAVKFDVLGPGWTVHFERSFPTNWTPTWAGKSTIQYGVDGRTPLPPVPIYK